MTIIEAAIIFIPAAVVGFGWIWAERKPAAAPAPTDAEIDAVHAALTAAFRRESV